MPDSKRFDEFVLPNGLHVAMERTPTATAYAKLDVRHGALNERKGEEGLAHLLEHCLFGGGHKFDREEVKQARGRLGASNAATSLDSTYFYADMLSEDLVPYLGILSDIVYTPGLDHETIDRERQVVQREISDSLSNPGFRRWYMFNEVLYRGSPYNRFIMGDEDIIEKATAEALRGFHSRGYSPNNSRLILVGGFPRNIREKVENIFGEIPQGDAEPLVLPVVQKLRRRKDIHVTFQGDEDKEKPERDSADIHIQFIVPPITEKASNPIKLAAFILGGSQSSGLYRRLREEKCLCYAVDSAYDGSVKHGKVSLYTKVPSVRQNEAIGCIFDVIDNLKRKGAPPEEVEDAKRRFIYNRAKYSETNTGIAATLEIELETGVSHAQYLEMLRAVTPEQVNRAFNEYFPSLSGKYIMMRVDPLKVNGK